ncbi:MAG TPA: hypothetical protein VGJ98_00290, partial [Candidatus Eisenbacteria bacterium]
SGVPGFTLRSTTGLLAGYTAGAAKFRIRYTHTVSGSPVLDSIDTPVTQDFYLHSPLTPTATGADSALVLGGLYKTALAIRFPVDSIPSGVSVEEATLILKLLPGSAAPDSADTHGALQIRTIRTAWTEAVTQQAAFTTDASVLTGGNVVLLYSSSARTFTIRMPGSLMREWAAMPSANQGLLVTLVNYANLTKRLEIGARESSRPAEVHVTYTELPPGRF